MTNPVGGPRAACLAKLRLKKVPVLVCRDRLPVFHVFEELYVRGLREREASLAADAAAEGA